MGQAQGRICTAERKIHMVTVLDKLYIKQGFRLGEWIINPLSGKFTRNGHTVHVEPKLMDVLLCLAGSSGEVVTRDELMGSVWDGVIVSDEALTRCISELRTLLGDTARERRYIRTIPKRGYSLLPQVETAPAARPVNTREQIKWQDRARDNSIVVLPFNNLCSGNDYEYFCDGLTEELINALARFTQLRVAARTSSFAFKGRVEDIKEIGRQLNISYILEGSVRIAGDKLRITAQLVSVADGFQLWADIFNRDLTGIFNIQAEIAAAVAQHLNLKFSGDYKPRKLTSPDTKNLEAYKWYLRGRRKFQTEQPGISYTGHEELETAIAMDPDFADAHGLLAYLYVLQANVKSYTEVSAKIRQCYQRALALNQTQPEALMAKAVDTRWQTWDWFRVRALFETALIAAPNNPTVLTQYACRFYRDLGDLDKAEELLLRALDIDPLNAGPRSALSYVLRYNGKLMEAIKQSELAIQLSPQYGFAHLGLILALIAGHEYATAQQKIDVAKTFLDPDFSSILQCQARLYAQSGDVENARQIKDKMTEFAYGKDGFHYHADIGWVCLSLGELDEGVSWFNQTLDSQNSQILVARVAINFANDRYQSFLQTPSYQAFLRRMKLDDKSILLLKAEGLIA